eukprot:1161815-Pelagomonas_calceolata.AAC.6
MLPVPGTTKTEFLCSRCLAPPKSSALDIYRCLLTCTVVTNVHLPCLMMSVQGMTLVAFAVKGEAMDASPEEEPGACYQQIVLIASHCMCSRHCAWRDAGCQCSVGRSHGSIA